MVRVFWVVDFVSPLFYYVWSLTRFTVEGYGTDFGARCTVIRLPDGGLFVHSPVLLTAGLRTALAALGPVRFLAVPTGHHVAFAEQWRAIFPAATCVAFPGARQRLACLSDAIELGSSAGGAAGAAGGGEAVASTDASGDAGISVPMGVLVPEVLSWVFLGAERGFQEVAFFHHPSATLVVTDSFFRIPAPPPGGFPLGARLFFWYLRTLAIPLHSALAWGAKATWRAEAAALVRWAPRRVIPCHGELVLEGAVDALRDFFRHRRGAF